MRKILFFIGMLVGFFACNDDNEVGFDVPVEFQKISFEPLPGGAMMRYKLPGNLDIFGVRVRYENAFGNEVKVDGSYLIDSLRLGGFTEARSEVPVRLSFFNREMEETLEVEKTFSTKAAATVALFDDLAVNPFWGGFNVTYWSPEEVDGMVHVFYLGINPVTRQQDSILMGSYPIKEGGDTLNFVLNQRVDRLDVVVRTDDYEGHRVKLVVKEDVPNLTMDTLSFGAKDFDFKFTGKIQESEEYGFGQRFLFDGKKKGEGYRSNILNGNKKKYDTFVAGPEAFSGRFIFTFDKPQVPAALYLYAFLNFGRSSNFPLPAYGEPYLGEVWTGAYQTRLPSSAKVYGVKEGENPETVDLSTCPLLCSFKEDNSFDYWRNDSWCKRTDHSNSVGKKCDALSDAEFAAEEPIVLKLLCNYLGEEFRHLVLVVEDTYNSWRWTGNWEDNGKEYVTFDEIDVVVQDKTEK